MSELHAIGTPKDDAKGDVVFVHGLGGDWRATWAADPSLPAAFWPQWLAADLPEINVWSLAYEASPSDWLGASMPLIDRATNVLNLLADEGLGTRPIVFICHSLGGLLVKQILRTGETLGEPAWRALVRRVRGIVFLATPHAGARLADYIEMLGRVLRASVAVTELQASGPALRDLNIWFRNNVRSLEVTTLLFFETQDTKGVRVVDEASADAGLEGVVPRAADGDHLSIAKPPSPTAALPKRVRRFARECLLSVPLDKSVGQLGAGDAAAYCPQAEGRPGFPGAATPRQVPDKPSFPVARHNLSRPTKAFLGADASEEHASDNISHDNRNGNLASNLDEGFVDAEVKLTALNKLYKQ